MYPDFNFIGCEFCKEIQLFDDGECVLIYNETILQCHVCVLYNNKLISECGLAYYVFIIMLQVGFGYLPIAVKDNNYYINCRDKMYACSVCIICEHCSPCSRQYHLVILSFVKGGSQSVLNFYNCVLYFRAIYSLYNIHII